MWSRGVWVPALAGASAFWVANLAISATPMAADYRAELSIPYIPMLVEAAIGETGERSGAVSRVAHQLGVGPESVRNWVKQAEIDKGQRPGLTTEERRRLVELERENRELRRANEILKSASAFFAAELDGRRPR